MCLAVVVLGFGFGLRKGGKGRGRVRVESNGGFSWLEREVEVKLGGEWADCQGERQLCNKLGNVSKF